MKKIRAKLVRKLVSHTGRYNFVPVRLKEKDGELFAEPILKGSGAITSLGLADGFIEIPETREVIEEGEYVNVILF